jgi:uncharacterized protein (DUF1778 family)
MATTETSKSERINLRLQHNAKQLLERAASFEGKSVSNFVLSCAIAQAKKTIHDHEEMELEAQASQAFLNALSKPVAFNDNLLQALQEHGERVQSK